MSRIVFLSYKHRYLSDRIYLAISKHLEECKLHYLDAEIEKINYVQSQNEDHKKLQESSINVHVINNPLSLGFNNSCKLLLIKKIILLRFWKRKLIKTVKRINPDVIVCIVDTEPNYKVIKTVFKDKFDVILIQHGQVRAYYKKSSIGDRFSKLSIGDSLIRKSTIVANEDIETRLLYWAPKWTSHFPDSKKIKHVGAISYDDIFNSDFQNNSSQYKQLINIDVSKEVVLIALNKSQGIGLESLKIFAQAYTHLVKVFYDKFFIFKIHPAEDLEVIIDLFSEDKMTNARFVKDLDWSTLLHVTDTFITHWSSTLYLSIAATIPTILFNPLSQKNLSERGLSDYQFIAKNGKELVGLVKYFSTREGLVQFELFRSTFIKESMLLDDGKSAMRAATAIKEVIIGKW